MTDLLTISTLPVVLTLLCFFAGQKLQQKFKTALLNPIILAMAMVLVFCTVTGFTVAEYKAGMNTLSWLLTPATICLAVPMYEQFQILRKSLPAIFVGVAAGAVSALFMVLGFCTAFGFEPVLTYSLLPKSITTAIGVVLSEMVGGMPGVTTAGIVFTGIFCNIMGPTFCKIFRLTDKIAQGVAYGTAGHVVGTAKANELDPLIGAVSSLSLVVCGLITAVIFPMVAGLV